MFSNGYARKKVKHTETWRDIQGFDGKYQVSDCGRIRGRKGIMKPSISRTGYPHITLSKNGKRYDCNIHRLVAEAFIPNPNKLPLVNHKDEVKINNCVENLEWCSYSYNTNYGSSPAKISKALRKRYVNRDNHPNSRNVMCIETGKQWCCVKSAGEEMGIDSSSISKVCRNERLSAGGFTWKYV